MNQEVARPSLPDFAYAKGYESGITHYLKDDGIFWSVVSNRSHPDKRDTEGDIVVLEDGSLLLAWSDFYTEGWHDGSPCRISMAVLLTEAVRGARSKRYRNRSARTSCRSVCYERAGAPFCSRFSAKGGPKGRCTTYVVQPTAARRSASGFPRTWATANVRPTTIDS